MLAVLLYVSDIPQPSLQASFVAGSWLDCIRPGVMVESEGGRGKQHSRTDEHSTRQANQLHVNNIEHRQLHEHPAQRHEGVHQPQVYGRVGAGFDQVRYVMSFWLACLPVCSDMMTLPYHWH